MHSTRQTPRTIRFDETIHMREFPREDSQVNTIDNQVSPRQSWEPNLSDTDVLLKAQSKKLKSMVIGIAVGGIVLIVIIIAIILGIILGQKTTNATDNTRTYNEACQIGSNQCITSQGLSCTNGFCSCSSPYSWNTAITSCSLLTYNQACSASNQCNSSLGLNCTNGFCLCDSLNAWNSINNTCTIIFNNTLSHGIICANGSAQCNSSVGLICTGSCSCTNNKIWNISNCVCPAGTFLNSSNLCQTAYSLNGSCTIGSNQCDSTKDLICNNSICQCDYSTKYWNINFQRCMQRLNYTQICVRDSDCLPTLICPTVPGVCNCSQYLPDLACNCPNTKYYDSTSSQCVNRATYNGACLTSANYTCLMSLYCNAGACACPTGMNWFAGNSTCITVG